MPSIITATAAVAVANSVMSGNLVSSSKQLSSSQESLAGDLVEPAVKREPIDGGEEDEYSEEDDADSEMSSDEMCLEAKEVVNYTSDESNSDEDDFRKDEDDSDYGDKKGNFDKRHPVSRSWAGSAVPPRLSLQPFFLSRTKVQSLLFLQPRFDNHWPLFGDQSRYYLYHLHRELKQLPW